MKPVRESARGRWRPSSRRFGIESRFLTGKHGPCPMCEGRDRFRFDDKDGAGTWFCTKCGAGDGVKLVMLKTGLDFKEAAKEIERHAGVAPVEASKPRCRTPSGCAAR
jgi:putative DNA primase/helicase